MKLNFSKYDEKENLMKMCEDEIMLSAYISLIITTYEQKDKIACLQILQSIYQTFMKARDSKNKNDV